jgi:hypothetical protein
MFPLAIYLRVPLRLCRPLSHTSMTVFARADGDATAISICEEKNKIFLINMKIMLDRIFDAQIRL